jgi:hypothetical protein
MPHRKASDMTYGIDETLIRFYCDECDKEHEVPFATVAKSLADRRLPQGCPFLIREGDDMDDCRARMVGPSDTVSLSHQEPCSEATCPFAHVWRKVH